MEYNMSDEGQNPDLEGKPQGPTLIKLFMPRSKPGAARKGGNNGNAHLQRARVRMRKMIDTDRR